MLAVFQQLINAWSIDLFFGWSIMDIFRLFLVLTAAGIVVNYFFDTAKR